MSRSRQGYGALNNQDDDDIGGRSRHQEEVDQQFQELADRVRNNIFAINANGTTLERALKQMSTQPLRPDTEERLHLTEQTSNRIVRETTNLLRRLSSLSSRSKRHQRFLFEKLTGEFKETCQRYNELQKKVAQAVKSAAGLSKPEQTLVSLEDDEDESAILAEERRQQQQMQEGEQVQADLSFLRDREQRVHQLETDILDINEIFQQLGTMVHQQGEMIDTIEDNVENAAAHVESGRDEIVKAAEYQRKARKKKLCILLILFIILAILVLVIVLSVKLK